VCSFEVCKSLTEILTLLGDVGLRIGPTRGLRVDGNISPQRRKKEKTARHDWVVCPGLEVGGRLDGCDMVVFTVVVVLMLMLI